MGDKVTILMPYGEDTIDRIKQDCDNYSENTLIDINEFVQNITDRTIALMIRENNPAHMADVTSNLKDIRMRVAMADQVGEYILAQHHENKKLL